MKKPLVPVLLSLLCVCGLMVGRSAADELEKGLQRDLLASKLAADKAGAAIRSGGVPAEVTARLKSIAEKVRASRLLMEERFTMRAQQAVVLGEKAAQRQESVAAGFRKALEEYLALIDAIPPDGTLSPATLDALTTLLNKIVPQKKRPLLGTLPYKHLNYPAREPATSPIVIPAYKGGNRTVSSSDTAASAEAPISAEITALAQSLQWNPVLIYEWVKNNVETEWYFGVMKGAEETLRQKSGNDADQAALLVSLLRASGFPARFVKGTIEFFPGIDKVKNLTGIDDPLKIAGFFQKAGIPFKPVIAGGTIANFQVEHVWVESQIPYANYRGAVMDDMGKSWLGLDTSIKPHGLAWNQPLDIPGFPFETLRDEYLQAVQTSTPLEFVRAKTEEYLAQNNPGKSWQDLLQTKTIIPDVLNIIPGSLQFRQIAITGEYTELPAELKHRLIVSATGSGSELFAITLDTSRVSNKRLALKAEPETVEDQSTIDSFGGLDNTPSYLVRLRPVLTLDGERLVVARDGLPMGADFTLNLDIITPNGTERINSSQITGNLAVIGIVSQKAITPTAISEEDDAEAILHKEAIGYIDRWNRAEDDLAALMGQRISRPTATIATVGGQIDVTWLMDTPHDFQWKGLFLDAGYRRIETVGRNGKEAEFMRLSALQGSILENRIFEDDLQVDSISTAKLLQQARANNIPILTIDKANIDAILSQLPFDETVKHDIANAVNQNLTVTIPQSEISYQDWSGIGYIKENRETGESGWMLSGQVAGGMTAPEQWVEENFMAILRAPYSGKFNRDPLSASRIILISSTNQQFGTVNKKLAQPLAVLVVDAKNRLVKGAKVTFKSIAGGGGFDAALSTTSLTVTTGMTGIAKAPYYLGKKTGDNPIYSNTSSLNPETTQVGLNLVTATVASSTGTISLADAFSSYALPDKPVKLVKGFGDNATNVANNPAGSLQVTVVDQFGNPVSNVTVQFAAVSKELAKTNLQIGEPAPLPTDARDVTFYKPEACSVSYPLFGECPSETVLPRISGYRGAFVNTILGDTVNTKYTVEVSAPGAPSVPKVTFTIFSEGYRTVGAYLPHALLLRYLEQYTAEGVPVNATRVGTKLSTPLTAEMLIYMDDYTMESAGTCSDPDYHYGDPYSCWQIVPSGKTIVQKVAKGKGTVTFTASPSGSGRGSMSPTRDMDNGKYEADYTAGSIPERSQITATGSATVTVPEAFADPDTGRAVTTGYPAESLTADKKQLKPRTVEQMPVNNYILFKKKFNATTSSREPIMVQKESLLPYTVFAVDTSLTVTPGAIAITKDGKAKRDTTFSYSILPDNYSAIISDIDIFRKDPLTGIEEKVAQLHGDKNNGAGTSTILAGSVWDVRKQYSARVTLNNGSKIEIDGVKTPIDILLGGLVPDYNHNRQIDDFDSYRAEIGDKYYFWINDDDGSGDTEGTGIPGTGSTAASAHFQVNGTRDLVDYFPVHLDLKDLFEAFDPAVYSYRLRNADSALRYVVTDLKPTESGGYLTGEVKDDVTGTMKGIDYVKTLATAPTFPITNNVFNFISAAGLVLKPEVIENIKNGKGIILIESDKKTTSPLVLEVYKGTTLAYSSVKLNLSIDGVEQMFRHVNLIQAIDAPNAPPLAFGSGGEINRLSDAHFANKGHFTGFDSQNQDKYFVMLHGVNVDGQAARGWHAEMFKRLYWAGSNSKFVGVSWYSTDGPSWGYYPNVVHAFETAAILGPKLKPVTGNSPVTIMAHSLGNMVVSSYLADHFPLQAPADRLNVTSYLMFNAAVALEAYLDDYILYGKGHLYDPFDSTNPMVHSDWFGYQRRFGASEWHQLFAGTSDGRNKLTWRSRFAALPESINYVNFFSSGENVLATYAGTQPPLTDLGSALEGRNSWVLQEKWKGRPLGLAGSEYMGWGFNLNDEQYYPFVPGPAGITGGKVHLGPYEANSNITDDRQLISRPFFERKATPGVADVLFTDSPVSFLTIKSDYNQLLTYAIPALTTATGGEEGTSFIRLGVGKDILDMNLNKDDSTWPISRDNEWLHSDIKEVAFPFVKAVFDEIANRGGLK